MKTLKETDCQLLGVRNFTMADQVKFSEISGDLNPIHINVKYSRRTQFGQVIVHGIHSVIWALENLFENYYQLNLKGFSAKFLQPIFLNEEVKCWFDSKNGEVFLSIEQIKCVSIKIETTPFEIAKEFPSLSFLDKLKTHQKEPIERDIQSLKTNDTFNLRYYAKINDLHLFSPILIDRLGLAVANEIVNLSALVGMFMPGKFSVFSSVKVDIKSEKLQPTLKIKSVDPRFGICKYEQKSAYTFANVATIFRAKSKEIEIQSTNIGGQSIKKEKLKNKRILIVGGSRGLGAKISTEAILNGANVMVTYNIGIEEAEQLEQQLSDYSGDITLAEFKAETPDFTALEKFQPNIICYMITPPIFSKRTKKFDESLFLKFKYFYCDLFSELVRRLTTAHLDLIYYPSSVAVDIDRNSNFEYASAKHIGEIYAEIEAKRIGVKVFIDRLPRLQTDQTATHLNIKSQDTRLAAMRIIKKIIEMQTE